MVACILVFKSHSMRSYKITVVLFVSLCVTGALAAKKNGRQGHTGTYQQLKECDASFGYERQAAFVRQTFGGSLSNYDPCMNVTLQRYKRMIAESGLGCPYENYRCLPKAGGAACGADHTFTCKKTPCYHMDHIVDIKNSLHGYQEQDFMILGNVVMAYSTWNIQIGQLAWESVKLEKREIYGPDIFDAAMEHVMRCASLRSQIPVPMESLSTIAPRVPPSTLTVSATTQISIPATTDGDELSVRKDELEAFILGIWVSACVAVFGCICSVMYLCLCKKRQSRNQVADV